MKDKKFDCVEMKWEIQQQIEREFSGVPEAQARESQMQRVNDDPILGPLYRDLLAKQPSKS